MERPRFRVQSVCACMYVTRQKEYRNLCKRVRRAVKENKEKWLDWVMKGLEGNRYETTSAQKLLQEDEANN